MLLYQRYSGTWVSKPTRNSSKGITWFYRRKHSDSKHQNLQNPDQLSVDSAYSEFFVLSMGNLRVLMNRLAKLVR